MRILMDTNVILDVLLKREAFYASSFDVLRLAELDDVQDYPQSE